MAQATFLKGVYVYPHDGKPEYVKYKGVVKCEEFAQFMNQFQNEDGVIFFEINVSKDGEKHYMKVDDYRMSKPNPNKGVPSNKQEGGGNDDTPF